MGWDMPRLVIAGTHSGVGKTSIAVGLARAFGERGLKVACFKCGPDYLDPTYHALATGGRPSINLDSWLMDKAALLATFAQGSRGCDIAIVEGVMGLYDGLHSYDEEASTAQIAKWLRAPVYLVADAAGMARSADALVAGFVGYDRDVDIAGVILNRVSSARHADLLRSCIKAAPVVGTIPKGDRPFGARHLGLKSAEFDPTSPEAIAAAARLVRGIDLDALIQRSSTAPKLHLPATPQPPLSRQTKVRIGVARDEAFHFYYPYNLAQLEAQGAELVAFSPLSDSRLPKVDGIIFGGGYPELYAARLSANLPLKNAIRQSAADGMPIYAECGGLIYLARELMAGDGALHELLGLIPGRVTMHPSLQSLGYVTVTTTADSLLGAKGTAFRGHEFRYSRLSLDAGAAVADIYDSLKARTKEPGSPGLMPGENILASYVHAHWAPSGAIAAAFVARCAHFGKMSSLPRSGG